MRIARRAFVSAVGGALAAGSLAVLAAAPAGALSFSVPAGRTIEDVDLSGSTGDFEVDGDASPETLSISADVNVLRLDDGSDITLAAGQVSFSLNLMLESGSLETTTDAFGNTIATADFSNGLAADFTLLDHVAGEQLFAADLGGPVRLRLTEGFAGLTGSFGAASEGGRFSILSGSVNPELTGKLLPAGDLALALSAFRDGNGNAVNSAAPLLDGGSPQGFEDFTAQPSGDFNFVPEPGSVALLGLGLAGLAARSSLRAGREQP